MSFYRDVYLKSEDWKNLRAAILARDNNKCKFCGKTSPSNDVHHIQYRDLYNVLPSDLVTLCRGCHDFAHQQLDELKKRGIKKWPAFRRTWKVALKAKNAEKQKHSQGPARVLLKRQRKALVTLTNRLNLARKTGLNRLSGKPKQVPLHPQVKGSFFKNRRWLVKSGWVTEAKMPPHQGCYDIPSGLKELDYLAAYVHVTGINPRKPQPDNPPAVASGKP